MTKVIKYLTKVMVAALGITLICSTSLAWKHHGTHSANGSFAVSVAQESSGEWYYTFKINIKNISSTTQNIQVIEFDAPSGVSFNSMTPSPQQAPNIIYNPTANGCHVTIIINGTYSLNPNADSELSFGVNGNSKDFNANAIASSVIISKDLKTDGKIILKVGDAPSPDAAQIKPVATVGDQEITFDSWKSSKTLDNLSYGEYKVHAKNIDRYIGSETTVSLSPQQKEQTVTITYAESALLEVTAPAQPDPQAYSAMAIKLQDITTAGTPVVVDVPWGQKYTLENLSAGDTYKLSTDKITYWDTSYIPQYNGTASDGLTFKADGKKTTTVAITYQKVKLPTHDITVNVSGLPKDTTTFVKLSGSNSYFQLVKNGANIFSNVVDDNYVALASICEPAEGNQMYRAVLNDVYTFNQNNTTLNVTYEPVDKKSSFVGKIFFHLRFPTNFVQSEVSIIPISQRYVDLVMSNFVAGVFYGHLIATNTEAQFDKLYFNKDYLYGSLFSQLLQENSDTLSYTPDQNFINPNPADRGQLLASGQGGPYQINDYAKRVESNLGLINFATLQKNLGFTIADQDSLVQNKRKGPETLDDKYFGPLAAAYFQYNDLLRLYELSKQSYWKTAEDYKNCVKNFSDAKINQDKNFLDMILNATYNAGSYSDITNTYLKICAHYDEADYKTKVNNISNYLLTDKAYRDIIGTTTEAGTTFILYPRQTRYYLDELYNADYNRMPFNLGLLTDVFAKAMHTLAYFDNFSGKYDLIDEQVAKTIFVKVLNDKGLKDTDYLNISKTNERKLLFDIIDTAITNLEKALKFNFGMTTNLDFIR